MPGTEACPLGFQGSFSFHHYGLFHFYPPPPRLVDMIGGFLEGKAYSPGHLCCSLVVPCHPGEQQVGVGALALGTDFLCVQGPTVPLQFSTLGDLFNFSGSEFLLLQPESQV